MKRVIITIVLLILSTRAMAFDFLGPPSADMGKDKSGLGIEYLHSEMNIDADDHGFDDLPDGGFVGVNCNSNTGHRKCGFDEFARALTQDKNFHEFQAKTIIKKLFTKDYSMLQSQHLLNQSCLSEGRHRWQSIL